MEDNPIKTEDKRNPDGTFADGNPGGPGRPKGKTLKEWARDKLMSMTDEEREEFIKQLPKEIVWKMAEGNPAQDLTTAGDKISPQTVLVKFIKDENDRDTNRISEAV